MRPPGGTAPLRHGDVTVLAFIVFIVTWHQLQRLAGQVVVASFLAIAIDTVAGPEPAGSEG
jgi:hypothetical protein